MCRFSGILLKHELRKKDVTIIKKKLVVITPLKYWSSIKVLFFELIGNSFCAKSLIIYRLCASVVSIDNIPALTFA